MVLFILVRKLFGKKLKQPENDTVSNMWVIMREFHIRESCSLWVEDRGLQVVQAKGGEKFCWSCTMNRREVVGRTGEERETNRTLTGENIFFQK